MNQVYTVHGQDHSSEGKAPTFTSSAITAASYDSPQRTLSIEFPDGTVYRYLNVPLLIYEELIAATSKGNYFNRRIRQRFPHTLAPAAHHHSQ